MGGAEMPDWLPWAVNFTACLATGILLRVHLVDERVKEIKRSSTRWQNGNGRSAATSDTASRGSVDLAALR